MLFIRINVRFNLLHFIITTKITILQQLHFTLHTTTKSIFSGLHQSCKVQILPVPQKPTDTPYLAIPLNVISVLYRSAAGTVFVKSPAHLQYFLMLFSLILVKEETK